MKREKHFVPTKERINIFYGQLTAALQKYNVQEVVRKGDRLIIKTELRLRDPKEKNLVVETEHIINLVHLLSCPDEDLSIIVFQYVTEAVDNVRKNMITEGMSKYFYVYWI